MPPFATHTRLPASASNSAYLQRTDTGQNWSQRNQRDYGFYTDQHGREWGAPIELKTGAACGPYEPIEWKITPPLMPPQKYLRRSPDRRRPTELHIDYRAWIQDERTERVAWERNVRIASQKLHGDKYDEAMALRNPSRDVLELVGPPPRAIEPIRAAMQGNPYVLGFTTREDVRLAKFFEEDKRAAEVLGIEGGEDFSELMEELEETHDPQATGSQNGRRSDRQLSMTPEAKRKRAARAARKKARTEQQPT